MKSIMKRGPNKPLGWLREFPRWQEVVERFSSCFSRADASECWEWLGKINPTSGYGTFSLPLIKKVGAHRIMWYVENNQDPGSLLVCHRCDNRKCVNPSHLFLGTNKDNMQDCSRKGRIASGPRHGRNHGRGEAHYRAKLRAADIPSIRSDYAAGLSAVKLGAKYGVSAMNAWLIATRRAWRHVQ